MRRTTAFLTLGFALLLSNLGLVHGASYGTCNATGASFYCPSKCGGAYVTDCGNCDGYMSSDQEHDICIDRRLFQPVNTDPNDFDDHYHYLVYDLIGAVVWFFTAGISIACGVGGGGIYVPLGILLFQFAPKQSSGFSQASIFGASLAGLILNSQNKHPVETIRSDPGVPEESRPIAMQQRLTKKEEEAYLEKGGKFYTRPVIDYDMALFMSPMQMAGAVLGVLVQRMLPNWLYLLFAGLVLSYTSYRTYKKYFASRTKETAMRRAAEEEAKAEEKESGAPGPAAEDECDNQTRQSAEEETSGSLEDVAPEQTDSLFKPTADEEAVSFNGAPTADNSKQDNQDQNLELRIQYLEYDMRQYPKEKIGALVLLWIGLFVLTLLQGGKGVESLLGIQCDSPWYYVMIVIQFLWLFTFAAYFGRKLVKDQADRAAVNYPYLGEEDPVWDNGAIRFYGAFCFVSGVVAALIGIGGGMVLGPMMLIMGIDARVSTATNSTMIVVTSSSIAIMFVTSGLVPWSYALFYFCVTFMGAWVGKRRIDGYVKRTGRASMLIFILASIIAFATVGCFVIFVTRLNAKDWCFESFQPFCVTTEEEEDCPVDRFLSVITSY